MQKFLSHTLTESDVKFRLAVPIDGLPHLPSFEGDARAQHLTMEDEEGKEWVFLFRIREGRHKKPEFSTGWLDFVRSKKLRIGDEIHLFKNEDEATGVTRYMIKAQKELRLFGREIYVPYAYQADR